MTLPKLELDIDASAYSWIVGNEILQAVVDGGPSRTRIDFIGAPSIASIQLVLIESEYQYLNAFYRLSISRGSLPFVMDMILDDAPLQEYQCTFVPGTFSLNGKSGDAFIVTAQLEVKPLAADDEYDGAIIMLFEEVGEDADLCINQLAHLANVDFPDSFGE